MLKLFVLPSYKEGADATKTIDSFVDLPTSVSFPKDSLAINSCSDEYDWYAIFYDNEFVDSVLREAIRRKLVLDSFFFNAFVVHKLVGDKIEFYPRLFRRDVILENFEPVERPNFLKIMDGWVHDQV